MLNALDYGGIDFPVSTKNIARSNKKVIFGSMFYYENSSVYSIYVSKYINRIMYCKDLLMITDENKSHYVYIKDFNRLMCNKTKVRVKNTFSSIFYNVLVVKEF